MLIPISSVTVLPPLVSSIGMVIHMVPVEVTSSVVVTFLVTELASAAAATEVNRAMLAMTFVYIFINLCVFMTRFGDFCLCRVCSYLFWRPTNRMIWWFPIGKHEIYKTINIKTTHLACLYTPLC